MRFRVMSEQTRTARFRLRHRRAVLAEVRRRYPNEPDAHAAAGQRLAEARALLPWWKRIGI
ncbi:hypothetical protein ABT023_16155 [Micromonospora sp. NPDC002296]|uniref:hypothetical protein n=1 Tax=Micromonospora sp. NPDC002296 TaxID=3154271 RepID=UPI0033343B43